MPERSWCVDAGSDNVLSLCLSNKADGELVVNRERFLKNGGYTNETHVQGVRVNHTIFPQEEKPARVGDCIALCCCRKR
jgi:hypothetical protein